MPLGALPLGTIHIADKQASILVLIRTILIEINRLATAVHMAGRLLQTRAFLGIIESTIS